jgi:hypothetical protein
LVQQIWGSPSKFIGVGMQFDLKAQAGGNGQVYSQLVEPLGDRHTIHRVNPLKMLEGLLSLITLEVADQMPSDPRQIREFLLLGNGLLDPTFTKISNPSPIGFSHEMGGDGLGNRNNPNSGWRNTSQIKHTLCHARKTRPINH